MEKLSIFSFVFLFCLNSQAQVLEILKSQNFDSKERLNSHRYGGISGLTFSDGVLWGISDDRGQFGPPRIYRHLLSQSKENVKNISIKIESELLVKEPGDSSIVDYEALYRFKDGRFLISSEGDLNKKPRVFPFVKSWSQKEKWLTEVVFPKDFLSEKIGMQTKGLYNNSAFEALTVSDDERLLYLFSEVPLFQNQKSEIEFLTYEMTATKINFKSRQAYLRDIGPEGSREVMRGVSEALYWKKDHLLILERWVRLNKPKPIVMGAELFSVNVTDLKKKKLFTFDGELAANWEGLAWGPDLSDGRKLLILVSDNNFERLTPTQYLFLAFKEEKP